MTQLEISLAKVMEFGSPAPLLEADPGKDVPTPVKLKQPVEEDLEFSSDSSVGSESGVETIGASGLPHAGHEEEEACRVQDLHNKGGDE